MAVASLDPVATNVYTLALHLLRDFARHLAASHTLPVCHTHNPICRMRSPPPPFKAPSQLRGQRGAHVPTKGKSETVLLLCRRGRLDTRLEGED